VAGNRVPRKAAIATGERRLLELIGDMVGLLEIEEFCNGLLEALHRAVPSHWVSLNDVGADPDTTWGIVDPPLTITDEQYAAFARYAHQNPLIERFGQTRDGRALRFSDVVTREELHAREIYKDYYAIVGVEHQISITLPHDADRILGIALSRNAGHSDFTDAERDLLNDARPFLIQAYRNAVRYSDLLAGRTRGGRVQRAPQLDRLAALGLTTRQAEVLQLLAIGVSERDIGIRLAISQRTVQKHLERCYRRLGVDNRSSAGAIAWSTLDTTSSESAEAQRTGGLPDFLEGSARGRRFRPG
jgi:DNA-binding CsgD family transcriptional regulator